ncbi:MAG TPA: phage holin family protein [Thermomicrobiales bacterium]
MGRFVRWAIEAAVIQAFILVVLAWVLPGFSVGRSWGGVVGAIVITVALAVAWPFIYHFAGRFHPLLFPVITFLLTGVVIWVVAQLGIGDVTVDDVWTGILVTLGMTIGNVFVAALFSLDDAAGYDWFVVRPLKKTFASTPKSDAPGVLFLEIDGLAQPILQQALDGGYMPTVKRWLDEGSHKLLPWEPDLSSQTSASQAGILLGDNTGIPAFRWYDKGAGKLMVSSKMETARELERRLSNGDGLLAPDGASRWNAFSGDAPDCLCTFSAVGDRTRNTSRSYVAYYSNPYTFSRTLALFAGDVVRERYQARRQVRRDELPRIKRKFKYALVRSSTTTVMQEASLFMLISDMFKGVPAVYNTFFAYDEVAHHSGIDRPDALKVLRTLDRAFAKLEQAAKSAPRPYHFVVLSDHGQSMGATFKQRYGQTLSDLVTSLISPENRVASAEKNVEDWGTVNLALTEAARQDGRTARLLKRAMRGRTRDGEVDLGPEEDGAKPGERQQFAAADVVVLASGNLGLISFPAWKQRMTYEEITAAFPGLLNGLARHEGIGFVMVHSETDGGIVIGPEGIRYLDQDYAVGKDPVATFGPNAPRHLKRGDGFATAPDILVMSLYDPKTGEVAAFEELVGCHGGLGGTQTQPFVLYPARFAAPTEPIVGAAGLYAVLKGWRTAMTGQPPAGQAAPAAVGS